MQRAPSPIRTFLRAVGLTVSVAVASTTIGSVVAAPPAAAIKPECDPTENPDCGEDPGDVEVPDPYKPAAVDLEYRLVDRVDGWKQAWKSRNDVNGNSKSWPVETYDPRYVHPTTFDAVFERQCIDQADWDAQEKDGALTINTYRWTVNSTVRSFRSCTSTLLQLPGEGVHDVRLDVISPSGTTLVTKQGKAKAEDHLIVLFGDSMASGEGSPEHARRGKAEFGGWIDKRCHRSSWAAVPRAAAALEASDPYSTVTFLDFACSGATIGKWVPGEGSGILGRYNGIEPPTEYDAEDEAENPSIVNSYLPSQVDQLHRALGVKSRNGSLGTPSRTVDKLFVSAGLNDVAFADMTKVCLLYTQCTNITSPMYDGASNSIQNAFLGLAGAVPGYYVDLDQALEQKGIQTVPGGRMIMEYPDPFTGSNGSLCTTMLEDVLPHATVNFMLTVVISTITALYLGIVTIPLAIALTALFHIAVTLLEFIFGVPDIWSVLGNGYIGELRLASDEISWMATSAMPHLMSKLSQAADDADFEFVDGIGDLFHGHGYCATDSWVARARRSSYDQGPYDWVSKPLLLSIDGGTINFGLDIHARTKGTIHPNRAGYQAVAGRLVSELEDLIDHPPVAQADAYDLDLAVDPSLDTGVPGVLANDTDVNGDVLQAQLVTGPTNGTAVLGADGRLQYTPKDGFEGWDTLTYLATDGELSSTATVSIHVYDSVGPEWEWTIPAELVIHSTGTLRFSVCKGCGYLQPRVNPGPVYGKVEFDRVDADWFATYTPPVAADWTLPEDVHFVIEIGTSKDVGHFEVRDAKEVTVQVVADRDPTTGEPVLRP